MINLLLILAAGYTAIGLLVGAGFAFVGVHRVDPAAAESPVVFRLLILPGSAGLWPVVLAKWLRAGRPGGGGEA